MDGRRYLTPVDMAASNDTRYAIRAMAIVLKDVETKADARIVLKALFEKPESLIRGITANWTGEYLKNVLAGGDANRPVRFGAEMFADKGIQNAIKTWQNSTGALKTRGISIPGIIEAMTTKGKFIDEFIANTPSLVGEGILNLHALLEDSVQATHDGGRPSLW